MIFEGRPLRQIMEADIRRVIDGGIAEHLHLEYKSEIYANDHEGGREQLLDTCMFANALGGILLIGISEQRDVNGQPTGIPDPAAQLGVQLQNPEQLLQSYDGRVLSCVEDRLHVESAPIPVAGDRFVLAFRVNTSTNKPHRVWYRGHTYFPSRRERQRYEMDVREIKELTMRTASQLERAEQTLLNKINLEVRGGNDVLLTAGLMPVFFQDFLINAKDQNILQALARLDVSGRHLVENVSYSFEGVVRPDTMNSRATITLMRNGLIRLRHLIPGRQVEPNQRPVIYAGIIDRLIRRFVTGVWNLYDIAAVSAPVMLAAKLSIPGAFVAAYGEPPFFDTTVIGPADFQFSPILIDAIERPFDKAIQPLCDHIHQSFGRQASPNFDGAGNWIGVE